MSEQNLIGRRAFIGGVAAMCTTPASARRKPSIVVTGDMGTVGMRMATFLSGKYDWTGIDIKRGSDEDVSRVGPWVDKLKNVDAVLHLAWDVPRFNTPEGAEYNLKITGTVLETCGYAMASHFIFASSAWAAPDLYGRTTGRPIPAIYSESKRRAEWMLLHAYSGPAAVSVIRFGQVNPQREDQSRDPDFDGRVLMTDADLVGLLDLGMTSTGIIGPFDARVK